MIRTAIAAAFLASSSLALAQQDTAGTADMAEAANMAGERVGTQQMVFETGIEGAAHASFLRGLALLHNFEYSRAAEAFRTSQAADPDFVMAYWGEAMTHNHPLWERQDRDAALAALAKLAPTPDARREKARGKREAQWLDAVETLFGTAGGGEPKERRDHLYLEKMRALLASDPADIDARAFTGLAILGTSHGGRQIPIYMEAAGLLEPGFITHQRHPGILHYLIHSYDDPAHAPLGERQAQRYAQVAPDAGHAQHMVSHIFHALGDWDASEAANINAVAVVDRQRIARGQQPAFCGHYNEWLAYALLQQGKDASTIVEGCREEAIEAIARGSDRRLGFGAASSYGSIALWNGAATGKWPEPMTIEGGGFLLARFDLATARLLANRDDATAIAPALDDLRSLAKEIGRVMASEDSLNTYVEPWMARQVAQGEALLALASGRTEEALSMLNIAGEAEKALPEVFGPPPMAMPSYELLGLQLLELGREEEAAQAFENALAFAPGRKVSLEGLEMARAD